MAVEPGDAGLERGCVQVYTGAGKGKTTAAFGLALRAAGTGLRVYIGQFLKSRASGEVAALGRFSDRVTVACFGSGRWPRRGDPEDCAAVRRGWEQACAALTGGAYDVVILDECLGAHRLQLLALEDLLRWLELRPARVELVLTGRDAPAALVERADLVSAIEPVKHYYANGLAARRGIEF